MHSLLFYLYINKNVGAAISRPRATNGRPYWLE